MTGFKPEAILKAERDHSLRSEIRAQAGKQTDPFDPERHMDQANPQKARAKPYGMKQAAMECAEMLSKAGWLRVRVSEVIK